jgi:V/A-type H+-transporting ATPase subunit I
MLRVSVIGHVGVLDETVRLIQRAGAVEVTVRELIVDEVASLEPDQDRLNELEEKVARASFVRDFLGRFRQPENRFSTFISEKAHVSLEEFERLAETPITRLCSECDTMAERLGVIDRERTRLSHLVHDLAPWESLRLQISQWQGTEHVALFTGTVPLSASEGIRQTLRETVTDVSVAEVGESAQRQAWVVMAHRDSLEDVRSTLALTEFIEVSFPGLADYPAEERSRALALIAELTAEQVAIEEHARELANGGEYLRSIALVQALLSQLDAEEIRSDFARTERTFVVNGWMPQDRREHLVAMLASVELDVDLTFEEATPDEPVPVTLRNPAILRPFEVLTDLYGRPRYGGIDPTPLLAGFFFLFFGMCIGDVGYGLMLGLAAWLIKHRLDVAPGVQKFMDLLMFGSVAAMLVGVATRSYFALSAEALPAFLRYTPLIDPLDEVMTLLIVSVALGVVHVSLGVLTNAYQRWRAGDILGALSEDLTTIALFVAIGFAVGFPAAIGWLLPVAIGLAVLFKGRILERLFIDRSPVQALVGVGKGLLGLYGMVGYASDFLSYTRLAALGLASLLVGDTMNRLAALTSEIPYGIGLLAAVLILVVGHTFNVVIALLGAFVHPTRLQFVEFFGKFYEGGGRQFAPFAPRTKSVVLNLAEDGSEGGVR